MEVTPVVDEAAEAAAATAKAEAEQAAAVSPELLAGKYKTPAELETAYKALEAKLGQTPVAVKPVEAAPVVADLSIPEANAGVDYTALEKEYAESGDLSEDTRAALTAQGIPEAMIEQHLSGLDASADAYRAGLVSEVGGDAAYTELVTWAKTNLSEEDIVAYDEAVNSGDVARAKAAASGLKARHASTEGVTPNLIGGENVEGVGGAYQSRVQMTADMNDPQYKKDPAFRKMVADKIAKSNIF